MLNENEREDDVSVEPETVPEGETELADIEDRSEAKVKDVKKQLSTCEEEKRNVLEELQRTKADFLNAKRRLEEEKVRDRQRTQVKFISSLLPLCDSFHMAMGNTEAWEKVDATWRTGVESIHAQLQSILSEHGVTRVEPLGAAFDPQQHEAVASEPVTDKSKHHTVTAVLQPGYQMTAADTTIMIRPARVSVGEYTEPAESQTAD